METTNTNLLQTIQNMAFASDAYRANFDSRYTTEEQDDFAVDTIENLIETLQGMVSFFDSAPTGQESERKDEWLPKARELLSRIGAVA